MGHLEHLRLSTVDKAEVAADRVVAVAELVVEKAQLLLAEEVVRGQIFLELGYEREQLETVLEHYLQSGFEFPLTDHLSLSF